MNFIQQISPWFMLIVVVLVYSVFFQLRKNQTNLVIELEKSNDPVYKKRAIALRRQTRRWPPGHPWAAIALVLLAFQQLIRLYNLNFGSTAGIVLEVVQSIACVLWFWTGIQDFRKARAISDVEASQESPPASD